MPASGPHFQRPHRTLPLAAALAAALAVLAADAHALDAANMSPLRLRESAQARLFQQFPGPRPARPPQGPAMLRAVTSCADDGPGSLREAVTNAEDGDNIDLSELACATITLTTGAIAVPVPDLVVLGPGRHRLAIDGGGVDRVFIHPYGGALILASLTVRNGRDRETGFDVAGGGCIASAGYLTLDDAQVEGCYSGGEGAYGGGIYAYSLTMRNSTLSGNVAHGVHENAGTAAFGGGAFVYTMDLTGSTLSGNLADHSPNPPRTSYDIGGGLITVRGGTVAGSTVESNTSQGRAGGVATFGDVVISNSTFSGNHARSEMAGALFLRRPATARIANSTFTGNEAATGGGALWLMTDGTNLESSLLWDNRPTEIGASAAVTLTGGHDLVGNADAGIALPSDTLHADPLLGPLAWNGGPTRTHALGSASPALDAGSDLDALGYDQRGEGFARVHGAGPDIGAFEQQPVPAVVAAPVPALSTGLMALLAAGLGALGLHRRRARG
jgi:hypothetical protein